MAVDADGPSSQSGAAESRWSQGRRTPSLIRFIGFDHHFEVLRRALQTADEAYGPAIVFAYTIKGWGLPIAGDPLNHSALLSEDQMDALRSELGIEVGHEWGSFNTGSAEDRVCRERALALGTTQPAPRSGINLPKDVDRRYRGQMSTQQVFGEVLTDLRRQAPEVARRVVTMSADVATSTNLGGWINRVGVWQANDENDLFSELGPRLISWNRRRDGQHIEFGLSETNLMMGLGQFGLSHELFGELLLPIGTIYDPFIARALDALIYSLYGGGRFILVGTPSGVSLAPEGGAHQSVVTPAIGLALSSCTYWEPCFGLETEWVLLEALRSVAATDGESAYLRLSTIKIDQALMPPETGELRQAALAGHYVVVDRSHLPEVRPGHNFLEIWATGPMVPIAITAAEELFLDGVYASVINCLSPDLTFRNRPRPTRSASSPGTPTVTVVDGHPATLAWLGAMRGGPSIALGVTEFGESGNPSDLYRRFGIDSESVCQAAFDVLGSGI